MAMLHTENALSTFAGSAWAARASSPRMLSWNGTDVHAFSQHCSKSSLQLQGPAHPQGAAINTKRRQPGPGKAGNLFVSVCSGVAGVGVLLTPPHLQAALCNSSGRILTSTLGGGSMETNLVLAVKKQPRKLAGTLHTPEMMNYQLSAGQMIDRAWMLARSM